MIRYIIVIPFLFFISCEAQKEPELSKLRYKDSLGVKYVDVWGDSENEPPRKVYGPKIPVELQVSEYIRRIFEDSRGDLWFGTNGEGLYRYSQGKLLRYGDIVGFVGSAVRAIAEDKKGNLWIATSSGLCKIEKESLDHPCFNNTCIHRHEVEKEFREHASTISKLFYFYGRNEGLVNIDLWCLLVDRNDEIWIGSAGGAYRMTGNEFKAFEIPAADLKKYPNAFPEPKLINHILQDRLGNIWFASNGNGIYRYDWQSLENISEKDGLSNNVVQSILEDKNGSLWFSTRFGGLSRFSEGQFTTFRFHLPVPSGLSTNFIWLGLEDHKCDSPWGIWFATVGGGIYYFNGEEFIHYGKKQGLDNLFIQSLCRDSKGNLWVGSSGGLYRLEGKNFINITKQGPWK
ncbi:MAG: hypothetical protein JNL60_00470 [Bacteroidia bacterium]|nr:hypothetical protein [Bacteroidia bacterium]